MDAKRQTKLAILRRQLVRLESEIRSLQMEEEDILSPGEEEDDAGQNGNVEDWPFSTWWRKEIRKGICYASVADAAAAYEAAGYKWFKG